MKKVVQVLICLICCLHVVETAFPQTPAVEESGSLKVMIEPQEAVDAGAQWRRLGTDPWFSSGEVETGVPPGTYEVEFSILKYSTLPLRPTLLVEPGQTTTVSATYLLRGKLVVSIMPQEAVDAGARWRPVGRDDWIPSGYPNLLLPIGDHMIEFRDAFGWTKPDPISVSVHHPENAATVTYPQAKGSLRVYIAPQAVVDAGAQWRRAGTEVWFDSGAVETDVPVESSQVEIEFKEVPGWQAPPSTSINVQVDNTTLSAGIYSYIRSELLWSTYIGGAVNIHDGFAAIDDVKDLVIDDQNNIYAVGYTRSSAWVAGGLDYTPEGDGDGFLIKISPSGEHLWSTYIGGSAVVHTEIPREGINGVTLDSSGNILVAGGTPSTDFGTGAGDVSYNGGELDAFAAKFNPSGQLLWASYIGGNDYDVGQSIAVNGSGEVYILGDTRSVGWTSGGYDITYNGRQDVFIAKLSADGQLLWSTYLGGGQSDRGQGGIAIDALGRCWVAGSTYSEGWVSGGYSTVFEPGRLGLVAFVAKVSPDGNHMWSTYVPGSVAIFDVVIDSDDNGIITGSAIRYQKMSSTGQIILPVINGRGDALALANDGTTYIKSGCGVDLLESGSLVPFASIGNEALATCRAIATDGQQNVVVGGGTLADGWTSGGFDDSFGSPEDGFIAKFQSRGSGDLPRGSLRVFIQPAQGVADGALWRRVGTTTWRESGSTESDVAVGTYLIEFSDVEDWQTPEKQPITLETDQLMEAEGIYGGRNAISPMDWTRYR